MPLQLRVKRALHPQEDLCLRMRELTRQNDAGRKINSLLNS